MYMIVRVCVCRKPGENLTNRKVIQPWRACRTHSTLALIHTRPASEMARQRERDRERESTLCVFALDE